MRRTPMLLICFLLLIASIVPTINSDEPAKATVLYVGGSGPGNYTTIQSAIDAASSGDTVFVYNGIYNESVLINNSINLIGEDMNNTILSGTDYSATIEIMSENVSVMGLNIIHNAEPFPAIYVLNNNISISQNRIDSLIEGIRSHSYYSSVQKNITITHNIFETGIEGIRLQSTGPSCFNLYNLTISHNIFYNDAFGIYVDFLSHVYEFKDASITSNDFHYCGMFYNVANENDSRINVSNNSVNGLPLVFLDNESNIIFDYPCGQLILSRCTNISIQNISIYDTYLGLQMTYSNNCTIIDNSFYNNGFGMLIGYNSKNNLFKNNVITNNLLGIQTVLIENNSFLENTIMNNSYEGIYLEESNINLFYHNTFVNNSPNAYDYGTNTWDNGYPLGGNYWDDYTSTDADGDGIGDTPYNISGGSNQDHYPLMNPITDPPVFVWVDDDYTSSTPGWQYDHFDVIKDGIDAVAENGTVYVYNGTYFENVIVNKTIDLIGEDRNNTIIDGNNDNYIIYVSADFTNIMNFEIKNSSSFWNLAIGIDIHANFVTISNNYLNNLRVGIWIDGLNNTIKNNNISSINYVGVHISSDNNLIFNNYVNSNGHCIFLDYAENNVIHQNRIPASLNVGIYLDFSNNNMITNNTINFHGCYGVYLDASINNIIKYNNISNNNLDGCIILWGTSTNNSIIENHVFSNNRFGIQIVSSSNNYVFHNELNDNNKNAKDTGSNFWDNGYPSGGNYWDDYSGTDSNGDCIGDIPYNITEGSNQDLYPFIEENGWLKSIDVDQDIIGRGFPVRHALDGDWAAAQSFKITDESLSRVDVYLRKFGTPEFNLSLELREDSPEGNLIESKVFTPEEVDINWQWIIMDLEDITTSNDTDYFIICPPAPSGVTTSFGYEWGYAFGNQYDNGSFWFTRDGGVLWRDLPTMYEFTFRTYGYS